MSRCVALARIVLDTVGLPGWPVEMTDLSGLGLHAAAHLLTRRIYIDRRHEDDHPAWIVGATVHEAAHALSSDVGHGPGWCFQLDRLVSERSVERIFTASFDFIVREWADEILQHQDA